MWKLNKNEYTGGLSGDVDHYQVPFKQRVTGSSPVAPTNSSSDLAVF